MCRSVGHIESSDWNANLFTLFIQECPLNLTNTLDIVQSRCNAFEFDELDRINETSKAIPFVKTDCTCASRVENNYEVVRSDSSCTFKEAVMQCREHGMQILWLVKWESGGRQIEIGCSN